MKVLFDYCQQEKAYGDSHGHALIELEDDEKAIDVLNKYVHVDRQWWEKKYNAPRYITEYTHTNFKGEPVVFTGRLVLMDTYQTFLD